MKPDIMIANRKQAHKYYAPVYLLVLFTFLLNTPSIFSSNAQCADFFILNNAFINLITLTHILPALICLCAIYAVIAGNRINQCGYYPPASLPVYNDTNVRLVKYPRMIFISSIVFFIFSLYLLYFADTIYTQMTDNKSIHDVLALFDAACE